jgi:hypothetical protein
VFTVKSPLYDTSKQPENVEYFIYLVSRITSDARYTREVTSKTAIAKSAFDKNKGLFTSKLDLILGRNE